MRPFSPFMPSCLSEAGEAVFQKEIPFGSLHRLPGFVGGERAGSCRSLGPLEPEGFGSRIPEKRPSLHVRNFVAQELSLEQRASTP